MSMFIDYINQITDTTNTKSVDFEFYHVLVDMTRENDFTAISPYELYAAFKSLNPNMDNFEQNDSGEFLRIFLEEINTCASYKKRNIQPLENIPLKASSQVSKKNSSFHENYIKNENSIVIDCFYGQVANEFECSSCKNKIYSFEKFVDIPLTMQGKSSYTVDIEDLLEEYFCPIELNFQEKCENTKCAKKCMHRKTPMISIPPKTLILSFQRYNPITGRKLNTYIKYKTTLNLKQYCLSECVSDS